MDTFYYYGVTKWYYIKSWWESLDHGAITGPSALHSDTFTAKQLLMLSYIGICNAVPKWNKLWSSIHIALLQGKQY